MVANSTYHADVDRMDNMGLVSRLDNAFDAMAENNGLVTVWLMEFVAEVVDLVQVEMEFDQPMDNGKRVKVLQNFKNKIVREKNVFIKNRGYVEFIYLRMLTVAIGTTPRFQVVKRLVALLNSADHQLNVNLSMDQPVDSILKFHLGIFLINHFQNIFIEFVIGKKFLNCIYNMFYASFSEVKFNSVNEDTHQSEHDYIIPFLNSFHDTNKLYARCSSPFIYSQN